MSLFRWLSKKKLNKSNHIQELAFLQETQSLSMDAEQNVCYIRETLGDPNDLIIRWVTIGAESYKAVLLGLSGMIDETAIQNSILGPITTLGDVPFGSLADLEALVQCSDLRRVTDTNRLLEDLLMGYVILLLDRHPEALVVQIQAFEHRNIEEPKSEAAVRGPHEGFTESIDTNISLIRRRLVDPMLRFDMIKVGTKTKTEVGILYIKDITDPQIVNQVKSRIQAIETEAILDSGYIEQFIEDEPASLFATVGNTERPDKAVGKLLEGRVCVLVNGSPTALTLPCLFLENLQSQEDYYSRPYFTSFVRIVRFVSFWLALVFPAVYVATQNFHKEMIPTTLLANIAAAREGVPLPLAMEVFLSIILFEILREAGVRMPRAIGQAVSIVGALILGDAAVKAGIIGTPTIIVVALSGIATIIAVPVTDALSILRVLLLIPASTLGLFGLLLGVLAILTHMSSLTSMGVPYMSPLAPLRFRDWKDFIIRAPLKLMKRAPESIPQQRTIRHWKP